ncbi:MAG: DUF2147 domain-containing protein [Phocaeicola sp.]
MKEMSTAKRFLSALLFVSLATVAQAQVSAIVGKWKTVDEKTGEQHSLVEIYKEKDGLYYGTIRQMLKSPNAVCTACEGNEKGKPLTGMTIIRQMKEVEGELKGGTILDPKSGKTYYVTITHEKESGKLKLRGSLDKRGFLGRNQFWIK